MKEIALRKKLELRREYQETIAVFRPEEIVFLDECLFLEGIREKIEDEKLDLTYDQRERAMWEYEHAVVEIEAWKTHLLRAFHQDLARLDAISSLDQETVMIRR